RAGAAGAPSIRGGGGTAARRYDLLLGAWAVRPPRAGRASSAGDPPDAQSGGAGAGARRGGGGGGSALGDRGDPGLLARPPRGPEEDLKQWMLALVISGEGIPQFLQPLDGNASDKRV